jgi:hypothetical protein
MANNLEADFRTALEADFGRRHAVWSMRCEVTDEKRVCRDESLAGDRDILHLSGGEQKQMHAEPESSCDNVIVSGC